MNLSDELLIAQALYPDAWHSPLRDCIKIIEPELGDIDFNLTSPKTLQALCRKFKISVEYEYNSKKCFIRIYINEAYEQIACNTDDEINTAIVECTLAIIKAPG